MRDVLIIVAIFLGIGISLQYCDSKKDAYEEGTHWDYSIICEDGFKYKCMGRDKGTIPCLNTDGTRLKCNQKRY